MVKDIEAMGETLVGALNKDRGETVVALCQAMTVEMGVSDNISVDFSYKTKGWGKQIVVTLGAVLNGQEYERVYYIDADTRERVPLDEEKNIGAYILMQVLLVFAKFSNYIADSFMYVDTAAERLYWKAVDQAASIVI